MRKLSNLYEHLNDENSNDEEAGQEEDDKDEELSLVDEVDGNDDDDDEVVINSDESSTDHEAGEGTNNLMNNNNTSVVTKSEQISVPVNRVGFNTLGNLPYPMITLTSAETEYYRMVKRFPEAFGYGEICMVEAGLEGGFINTQELHVMKFEEAMAGPEVDKWEVAVDIEHARMVKSEVFKAIPIAELPDGATILLKTWP